MAWNCETQFNFCIIADWFLGIYSWTQHRPFFLIWKFISIRERGIVSQILKSRITNESFEIREICTNQCTNKWAREFLTQRKVLIFSSPVSASLSSSPGSASLSSSPGSPSLSSSPGSAILSSSPGSAIWFS